jgi:hypothetical protein
MLPFETLQLLNHPNFADHEEVLRKLGVLKGRADAAGDTLYLARELEHVSAQSFDVLKDPKIGRQLVPFVFDLPDGAETYSFDMYDGIASGGWITNWATVIGQADAFKTRVSIPARSWGSSYHYTVQDLAAASMASGRSLDAERGRFCRLAHEQFFEDLIADGDAERGIPGLPGLLAALGFTEDGAPSGTRFPWVSPITGTWDAATTGPEKVADLEKLVGAVEQNTKQLFVADRLVLPLSTKPFMRAPYNTTVDARSTEKVFLENQPANGVKAIDYWYKLDTKSALGGPRALAYKASPDTFKFVLAYDFRELAPQLVAYQYQIPTLARVAGLISVYPLAMAQMDLDS